jgi:hypothetical protein
VSIGNRIRLIIGVLLVIAVVFGLFVYLNYSMSNRTSRTAQLDTDQYVVSVDYGGTVEKQFIRTGDTVEANDALFEINSPTLQSQLDNDSRSESDLLYSLTDEGNILIQAANSGVVRNVQFPEGSYVPDNGQLATLTITGTDYVTAKYSLNAPDYARINKDNPLVVTLPDNTMLEAKVFDITLERSGDTVLTVVKARFGETASIPATFSSGTPVSATWELEYDGLYKSIADRVRAVFQSSESES